MIKQFSASFDKIQDRLLLRFNTTQNQEFRFWLTRRRVINFLEMIPRHSEQAKMIISNMEESFELTKQKIDSGKKNLASSNKDENKQFVEILKKTEINKEKKNLMPNFITGKIFPTGEEAILVREIDCKLVNKSYNINFYLANNKKVNFSLSLDTFLSLHSLLEMKAKKADWNIQDHYFTQESINLTLN